ncbi:MAG: Y-family DNA polymerase [Novosphingobium sp.]
MQPIPRRCLALWFPWLACERLRRTGSPGVPAPPEAFALVARVGNALRLTAVDGPAAALGLEPGLALADARARCPELATLPADPAADAAELARLVRAMRKLTPLVSADPPDGIVLDITGCAHLFGGEAALAERAVALAGYTARHALAGSAAAARALARHGGGSDVMALPVAALELEEEALAALRRAGLRSIGDLARRPSPALAARFGEAAVTRLRQLTGELASPIEPWRAPAPIRLTARFAEPIARTDDVLEAIEDLLMSAAREMEERGLGGRRFAVLLHRSDNQRRRLAIDTAQPVRDPAVVLRLLRERIETLADPLDPGFGFDAIELAVTRTEPLAARQLALSRDEDESEDTLAALLDRLGVRLGTERVQHLAPRDRHIPERAQALAPVAEAGPSTWPKPGERPPRPLLLFDPPQPVSVIAGVPDGPPQRFRWQGRLHEVRLAEGPERIGAEWWLKRSGHRPGGARGTRDYYRIEVAEGRRYWIFRYGLYGETADPRWYLHGLFA